MAKPVLEPLTAQGVVGDVLPLDWKPQQLMDISFASGAVVEYGNVLKPAQVNIQPVVRWEANPAFFYTLIMIDPDNLSRQAPTFREYLHWAVSNIPGNDISRGEVWAEFMPSGPMPASGLHRYVFLLFSQPRRLPIQEPHLKLADLRERGRFSAMRTAAKYGFIPLAANFYQAEYDSTVPAVYEAAGRIADAAK